MEPIVMQDPGSNIVVTITQFELRTAKTYYDLGEFLASRFQHYWGQQKIDGQMRSVDQEGSWRAECARINNAGGLILQANHTSGNKRVIGVLLSKMTETDRENAATVVVNGAAFDTERLQQVMYDAAEEWWKDKGVELGKDKFETLPSGQRVRVWVKNQ